MGSRSLGREFPRARDHPGGVELDVQVETVGAQGGQMSRDLLRNCLWGSDVHRSTGSDLNATDSLAGIAKPRVSATLVMICR